jgi:hypothetical protein
MSVLRCVQTARVHAAETRSDLSVCTDSSTDTVANRSSTWLKLIALLGLRLVKPFTFTEANETKHGHEQLDAALEENDLL